jgi:hypothetical protein
VWTGQELLIWSGDTGLVQAPTHITDGFAYTLDS